MERAEAVEAILGSPFGAHAVTLEAMLQPAIRLTTEAVEADVLAIGESRLSGPADLPPAFEWPRMSSGTPLELLVEIDLAAVHEAHPSELPPSGWLCFFLNPEGQADGFRPDQADRFSVCHFDVPVSTLERRRSGPASSDAPARLRFSKCFTLPDSNSDDFPAEVAEARAEPEGYDAYARLVTRLAGMDRASFGFHHLLGHPQLVQHDLRIQCEAVSRGLPYGASWWEPDTRAKYLARAMDWRLLLQVDSQDQPPRMLWGDNGTLYFMIRDNDLIHRRFHKCWCVMQCC